MRPPYPSDLSDAEWAILAPLLPPPKPTGRPRKWPDRLIADAVFSVLRSGCAWRMLPREFPPWPTVFSRFRRWRLDGTLRRAHDVLRALTRRQAGRAPEPQAAIIDSQSAKTTGVGGPARGYDGGKRVKGRKRHILVDVMGLLLAVCVHGASIQDREGARLLAETVAPNSLPALGTIWADQPYRLLHRGTRGVAARNARVARRGGAPSRAPALAVRLRGAAGAHVPRAAAPLGRRADVRLARPVAPAEQGLRAAAGHERGHDLRRGRSRLMLRRLTRSAGRRVLTA